MPACDTIHETIGDVRIEVATLDWGVHHRDPDLQIQKPRLYTFVAWARPSLPEPAIIPLLGDQVRSKYTSLDRAAAIRLDFDGGPTIRRVVPVAFSPSFGFSAEWPVQDRALQQQILAACKAASAYRIRIEDPEGGGVLREARWSLKGYSRAVARAEVLAARQKRDQAAGRC